jgi:endoglucanase
MKKIVAGLAALIAVACAPSARTETASASAAAARAPSDPAVWPYKRGVNIIGYDPIWKDPTRARFQEKHFGEIRRGGFDFVRVNLHGFAHMDKDNRIDPKWFDRLDWVVREASEAGLGVILDEHDFDACAKDVPACRVKLPAFWRQVAPRYKDAPKSVAFELMNEPYGPLDADTWNAFFPELLAIVRETNPSRTVVIGPTQWNNFKQLQTLKLPESDRNILATFHYYEPFQFTHQGASWAGDMKNVKGVQWSEEGRLQARRDFATVVQWARANNRPVLLGEFGAYDMSGTPIDQRVAYTKAIREEAEAAGIPWAYWQFDSNFLVWDMAKDDWVEPIRSALIPKK